MPAQRRRGFATCAVAVAAIVAGPSTPALAAEGDLDPGFSGDGIAQHDFQPDNSGEGVAGLMIDRDGRITGAGIAKGNGYGAVRYLSDGTPDSSFGTNGVTFFRPAETTFASFSEAALSPEGRLVMAGFADAMTSDNGESSVAVLTAGGQPDPSFGNDPPRPVNDGFVMTDFPGPNSFDVAQGVAIDAQGRMVVVGRSSIGGVTHSYFVRYLADGSLDPGFANEVKALGGSDTALDVVIQPDGKLLALVHIDGQYGLVRLTQEGELDSSYGAGGFSALTGLTTVNADASALALQADGKPLALVQTGEYPDPQMRLARVDAAGALDPTFGSGGIADLPAPGNRTGAGDIAVADDGRITVAGGGRDGVEDLGFVWRLLPNGQPDANFASAGVLVRRGGAGFSSVAIQPDRKVVVGGLLDVDPSAAYNGVFLTMRLIGDETPPDTKITKAPKKVRAGKKAKVAFRAKGDVNTTFECAVKMPKRKRGAGASKTRFSKCDSPEKTKRLKRAGKTVFLVRAVDPAGNADPKPAKAKLKVKPKRR